MILNDKKPCAQVRVYCNRVSAAIIQNIHSRKSHIRTRDNEARQASLHFLVTKF